MVVTEFMKNLADDLMNRWLIDYTEDATDEMLRISLANVIKDMYINQNWRNSLADDSRKVHYMSMEFMVGKLTKTNLVNLDILDEIEGQLKDINIDLKRIFSSEIESKTANGGLGRLAYAILNGLSNKDINASGQSLLYKHGIFQQQIIDGKQVELPDIWRNVEHGYEWYNCLPHKAKVCKLFGEVRTFQENNKTKYTLVNYTPVQGVPYDVPVVGFRNNRVNSLRLWEAKEVNNKQLKDLGLTNLIASYNNNMEYIKCAREITDVLYPDDSTYEGKMLRVKQEYFCSTMALQTIIEEHLEKFGTLDNFADKNVIHINDTHCSWAVPELMRILLDEYDYYWEDAWDIVNKSITYTNHTVLQEALEKWDCNLVRMMLPRIYMIIEEINRRQNEEYSKAIIKDGLIYTANMLIEAAYSVNGVAEIHSEIIKNETFKEFNKKYPSKFKNVTNGIEGRKWLLCDSIEISNIIDKLIGENWKYDFRKLEELEQFKEESLVRNWLRDTKYEYKVELAEYIKETTGVEVDPNAMFLSHTKRLHAYKRQSMVILAILRLYHELLENPMKDVVPKVFIFSAKAAPGYHFAKCVIKVINEVANVINNDERIGNKLKVLFLENYNVGVAEKIIKGTDVSIQVPTAGQEASGTGNMKYMMLGSLTHATLDGANVEIHDLVGDENMFLFGLQLEDVNNLNHRGYNAWDTYNKNYRVKQVFDDLVNGFIPNIYFEGKTIFNEILSNDVYYVTQDLPLYLDSLKAIDDTWRNPSEWYKKVIVNIAKSGFFDIQRSVEEYCDKVWKTSVKNYQ
jgi:starch phosphorylase